MSTVKRASCCLALLAASCAGPAETQLEERSGGLSVDVNDPTSVVDFLRITPSVLAISALSYAGSDGNGYCTRAFTNGVAPGGFNHVWQRVPIVAGRCDWLSPSSALVSNLMMKSTDGHAMTMSILPQGLFLWHPDAAPAEFHQSVELSYLDSAGATTKVRLASPLGVIENGGAARADRFVRYQAPGASRCLRAFGSRFVTAPSVVYGGLTTCDWLHPSASPTLSYVSSVSPFPTATATINVAFSPNPIRYLNWQNQPSTASVISFVAPVGPYTSSCNGVGYDGVLLSAACRAPSGAFVPAQISDYGLCVNQTPSTNNDVLGFLSCYLSPAQTGPFYTDDQVPPGSYLGSCIMPSTVARTLTAQCRNNAGSLRFSALHLLGCLNPGGDIFNVDGTLRCTPS